MENKKAKKSKKGGGKPDIESVAANIANIQAGINKANEAAADLIAKNAPKAEAVAEPVPEAEPDPKLIEKEYSDAQKRLYDRFNIINTTGTDGVAEAKKIKEELGSIYEAYINNPDIKGTAFEKSQERTFGQFNGSLDAFINFYDKNEKKDSALEKNEKKLENFKSAFEGTKQSKNKAETSAHYYFTMVREAALRNDITVAQSNEFVPSFKEIEDLLASLTYQREPFVTKLITEMEASMSDTAVFNEKGVQAISELDAIGNIIKTINEKVEETSQKAKDLGIETEIPGKDKGIDEKAISLDDVTSIAVSRERALEIAKERAIQSGKERVSEQIALFESINGRIATDEEKLTIRQRELQNVIETYGKEKIESSGKIKKALLATEKWFVTNEVLDENGEINRKATRRKQVGKAILNGVLTTSGAYLTGALSTGVWGRLAGRVISTGMATGLITSESGQKLMAETLGRFKSLTSFIDKKIESVAGTESKNLKLYQNLAKGGVVLAGGIGIASVGMATGVIGGTTLAIGAGGAAVRLGLTKGKEAILKKQKEKRDAIYKKLGEEYDINSFAEKFRETEKELKKIENIERFWNWANFITGLGVSVGTADWILAHNHNIDTIKGRIEGKIPTSDTVNETPSTAVLEQEAKINAELAKIPGLTDNRYYYNAAENKLVYEQHFDENKDDVQIITKENVWPGKVQELKAAGFTPNPKTGVYEYHEPVANLAEKPGFWNNLKTGGQGLLEKANNLKIAVSHIFGELDNKDVSSVNEVAPPTNLGDYSGYLKPEDTQPIETTTTLPNPDSLSTDSTVVINPKDQIVTDSLQNPQDTTAAHNAELAKIKSDEETLLAKKAEAEANEPKETKTDIKQAQAKVEEAQDKLKTARAQDRNHNVTEAEREANHEAKKEAEKEYREAKNSLKEAKATAKAQEQEVTSAQKKEELTEKGDEEVADKTPKEKPIDPDSPYAVRKGEGVTYVLQRIAAMPEGDKPEWFTTALGDKPTAKELAEFANKLGVYAREGIEGEDKSKDSLFVGKGDWIDFNDKKELVLHQGGQSVELTNEKGEAVEWRSKIKGERFVDTVDYSKKVHEVIKAVEPTKIEAESPVHTEPIVAEEPVRVNQSPSNRMADVEDNSAQIIAEDKERLHTIEKKLIKEYRETGMYKPGHADIITMNNGGSITGVPHWGNGSYSNENASYTSSGSHLDHTDESITQTGENPFGLSEKELDLVNRTYNLNIQELFPDDDAEEAWEDIKNSDRHPAEEYMDMKVKDTPNEYKDLVSYLHKIEKVTGLEPKGAIKVPPTPAETIEEYMQRALQFAAKKGTLGKLLL